MLRTAFGKGFGGLAQEDTKTGEKGSNSIFVLDHEGMTNIPKDRKVRYEQLMVDYREQKKDPNRVRLTVGGNLIQRQKCYITAWQAQHWQSSCTLIPETFTCAHQC